jgi:putative DNA primase/helicase
MKFEASIEAPRGTGQFKAMEKVVMENLKVPPENVDIETKSSKPVDPVSRVRVVKEGRDESGNRYIKLGIQGATTTPGPYSMGELIKSRDRLFTELANAGVSFLTPTAQRKLLQLLQNRLPGTDNMSVATQLGWHGSAFVLSSTVIGEKKELETAFGDLDPQMLSKFRVRGELQDWQDKIAELCRGNSRLMFAVSLAFTGPILRFVQGPRSGGFQIWGDPETGKTTAAMVAGSVWGCHRDDGKREKGFAESWHTTAGKLELTALAHNNTVLILDETKRAGRNEHERAKAVLDVAVGLAEHTEKERLTNLGSTRSWRLYFLSTSNLSLIDLARRGNIFVDDAELGRLVDVPLPNSRHGLFEQIHKFGDGARFTSKLKSRSRRYFGSAGFAFVTKLVAHFVEEPDKLKQWLEIERQVYLKRIAKAAKGLSPLKRASDRFATSFAAGSLAIKYGILPWSRKKLLHAILSCQLDGLRHVGDDPSEPSVAMLRAKLVSYVRDYRKEFIDLARKRPRYGRDHIDAVPGYRAVFKGWKWIYLTATKFTEIIGGAANADMLKEALAHEGLLAKAAGKRFVVQRQIFKGGKGNQNSPWVHALKAGMFKKEAAD